MSLMTDIADCASMVWGLSIAMAHCLGLFFWVSRSSFKLDFGVCK